MNTFRGYNVNVKVVGGALDQEYRFLTNCFGLPLEISKSEVIELLEQNDEDAAFINAVRKGEYALFYELRKDEPEKYTADDADDEPVTSVFTEPSNFSFDDEED